MNKMQNDFFEEVKNIVTGQGMIIEDVNNSFDGIVKRTRKPKHFATYLKDGQHVLIKAIHREITGSAADKLIAFYINLLESQYDKVIIVLSDRLINEYDPYLDFFNKQEWTLDNISIMSIDDFKNYIM